MKDSGGEWIGEVPEEWEIGKIGFFYNIQLGKMLQPNQLKSTDTFKQYLCAANIDENGLNFDTIKEMWIPIQDKDTYLLKKGDLLVVEGGDVGLSAIFNGEIEDCYFQNALHRVRNKKNASNEYLLNWLLFLKNIGYIDLICNKATIAHFTKEKFVNTLIVLPPLNIQNTIVSHISNKTSKIDSLIADLTAQIEKIKEYRQAIISEAVTKGLNKNAKMKDSGVEWIGEVPEKWEISKMKYKAKLYTGTSISDDDKSLYLDETFEYPYISSKDIDTETKTINYENGMRTPKEKVEFKIAYKNSTLLCVEGGSAGKKIALLTNDVSFVNKLCCFNATTNIESKYLFYYLQTKNFSDEFILNISGLISGVSIKRLMNFVLPCPLLSTQVTIINYLDSKISKIDSLTTDLTAQIEKLKEFRQSIVSEAVTGRIMIMEKQTNVKKINANLYLKHSVLGAHILNNLCDEPTMGHVKFEKLLFLSEYSAELKLNTQYFRRAAGPYNGDILRSIDNQLKEVTWFEYNENANTGNKYRRLQKSTDYKIHYEQYFDDRQKNIIDKLLNLFRKIDSQKCQIVATLYAAWNDFLIEGIQPSEKQIIDEILTNWHKEKEKISRYEWSMNLKWMRANNMIPKGYGLSTKGGLFNAH
jgi:type I restriction enzyme S subunit